MALSSKLNTLMKLYPRFLVGRSPLTTLETRSVQDWRYPINSLTFKDRFHEAVVNLSSQKIETNARLGPNHHGNGDYDEILTVEKNALEDEGVKAEIEKLKLPEGTAVCADPWIYGRTMRLVKAGSNLHLQDLTA